MTCAGNLPPLFQMTEVLDEGNFWEKNVVVSFCKHFICIAQKMGIDRRCPRQKGGEGGVDE